MVHRAHSAPPTTFRAQGSQQTDSYSEKAHSEPASPREWRESPPDANVLHNNAVSSDQRLLAIFGARADNLNRPSSAIQNEGLNDLRELLGDDIDMHATTSSNQTALHLAASEGRKDVVELLLVNGAEVDARDEDGQTALMITENIEIAKLLLKSGASVDARDDEGQTALIVSSNSDISRLLLERGADVHARDSCGQDALMHANDRDVIQLLLARGADVKARDQGGQTALMWAAEEKEKDQVELLLANDAEVDARNERGETAFCLVMQDEDKNYEIAPTLIGAGANIKLVENTGKLPFDFLTINNENRQGVKELIEAIVNKGDFNFVIDLDNNNKSLYHYAVECGDVELVKKVREKFYMNINASDINGRSPLHYAVIDGNESMVDSLLAIEEVIKENQKLEMLFNVFEGDEREQSHTLNNLEVARDRPDVEGKSPLHHAAESGNKSIFDKLKHIDDFEQEPDNQILIPEVIVDERKLWINTALNQADKAGKTPLDYAHQRGWV